MFYEFASGRRVDTPELQSRTLNTTLWTELFSCERNLPLLSLCHVPVDDGAEWWTPAQQRGRRSRSPSGPSPACRVRVAVWALQLLPWEADLPGLRVTPGARLGASAWPVVTEMAVSCHLGAALPRGWQLFHS